LHGVLQLVGIRARALMAAHGLRSSLPCLLWLVRMLLRWFMSRWAMQMNLSLAQQLTEPVGRTMQWHPETTTTVGLAADGLRPSSEGYAAWADGLSRCILAAQAPCAGLAT
jgi:hypothetical protein